jgi:hypothetical protein
MSSNYLQDMLARFAAMEEEAVSGCDAAPYWPYQQGAFPYWSNRLGTMTLNDSEFGEDIQQYIHQVLARFVIAHLESGYHGENADKLVDWLGDIQTYFRTHPMLTTDAGSYTAPPDFLHYEMRMVSHTGLVVFQNAGIGSNQLGVEFTFELPYMRSVY